MLHSCEFNLDKQISLTEVSSHAQGNWGCGGGGANLLMNEHILFLGWPHFFFYVCMHDSAMRPMYFANGSRGWGEFIPSC